MLRIAALEPRVLLDAAAAATVVHAVQAEPAKSDGVNHHPPPPLLPDLTDHGPAPSTGQESSQQTVVSAKTLVVVDSRVDDAQSLLDGLDATVDVLVLDAGQSGVDQIAAQLQGGGYSAINVIAHGSSGSLELGSDVLTAESVNGTLAAGLNQWRSGLTGGADLLIWGCDVGSGSSGGALIDALGRQTGADVATSTDATGSAAAGGDWVLEAATGTIEAAVPFSSAALSAYDGLLAAPTVSDSVTTIRSTNEDTPLTVTGLTVGDADGDPLTVTLHATNSAGSATGGSDTGTITLATTANHTVSGNGTATVSLNGSVADINAALAGLSFASSTDWNGTARIAVRANDGTTDTDRNVAVSVISINDAPGISPTPLSVAEGGSTFFSSAVVGLSDPDIATGQQINAQEMICITSLPSHGTLSYDGSPVAVGTVISYDQIGLLKYTHSGADVQVGDSDSFTVTINDGAIGAANSVAGTLSINLTPVNAAPTVSGSPSVYEGQPNVVMGLTITDEESGHADAPSNLTVTVVSTSLGGEGTLYFDANSNGTYDAGEEVGAGFTFAGNQTGSLRFSHAGGETNSASPPSFVVKVTDAGGGQGAGFALSSADTTITISIIPVDDNPTLTSNTGFSIALVTGTNTVHTLTTAELQVSDVDSPNNQLVYTVVSAPTYGVIQVWVSGSWKTLGSSGRFTQDQIDAGYVRYVEELNLTGGATDTFKVSVRDSAFQGWPSSGKEGAIYEANGTTIAQIPVSIALIGDGGTQATLTPPDTGYGDGGGTTNNATQPPAAVGGMTNSNMVAGVTNDTEGSSGMISGAMLNYEIADASRTYIVPATETVYTLTAAPVNGDVQVWRGGAWVSLALFGTFTQADINANHVRFLHDGNEVFTSSFTYRVSDGGQNYIDSTFTLDTTPINDTPVASGGTIPTIERVVDVSGTVLSEGTVRVTTTYMGVRDADGAIHADGSVDAAKRTGEGVVDNLWFQVTSLPADGTLQRWNGTAWVAVLSTEWLPVSLLSLAADGATSGLRYIHGGGDQPSELVDSFNFVIRDDLTAATGATEVRTDADVGTAATVAAGSLSNTATVNLSVANYNDPPIVRDDPYLDDATHTTITDKFGVSDTTVNEVLHIGAEGGSGTITAGDLNAVDTDNTSTQRQYRIVGAVSHGTLYRSGVALGVGSYFTQTDIDNGLITYTHDGSENLTDNFTFIVSDGVFDTQTSIYRIVVDSAGNDAPTVSASPSSVTFTTAAAYDFGTGITIGDPDLGSIGAGETDFVQVTLTVKLPDTSTYAGATLTLGSTAGITVTAGASGVAGGQMVIQGALADVQAALTHLTLQVAGDEDRILTLQVTVDDRLRDGTGTLTSGANGGATNQDGSPIDATHNTATKTITINASNSNDPPVVSSPATVSVNEDTSLAFTGGNAISVSDPDIFSGSMTVTLGVGHGTLTVGSAGGATVTGSASASVTITGTSAQVATALGSLSYKGATDWHGSDTLSISVNDNGNSGVGGAQTGSGSVAITVVPVNDTPTISAPGAIQNLSSGSTVAFGTATGNAISVADAKDSAVAPFTDNQTLTLTVTSGTLTLAGSAGLTVTGDGTGTVVVTGALAAINTALNGLVYTATNNNLDATVNLVATLNDLDNGGTTVGGVGPAKTATATVKINVSVFNEAPVVASPLNAVSVAEDASVTLTTAGGTAFSFSDADDFGATNMQVTVTATHGTLTLAANDGTTVGGSGTATLTLTGTKTQINNALDGLIYTPTGNYHGSATLTVTASDNGNTGSAGGVGTDTKSITVTVTPVNDAPVASGSVSVTATEDATGPGTVLSTLITGTQYSDATDDQTGNGGNTTATSLTTVAIVGNASIAAQGTWQVSDGSGGWIDVPTAGLSATTALVIPADREIRFVPAADFEGTPGSLSVRLADGSTAITSSTGAGDLKNLTTDGGVGTTHAWSTGNVTISSVVDPVNDRPTATGSASLAAIGEDAANPPGNTVTNLFAALYGDATDNQTAIAGGGDTSTAFGGIAVVGNAATAAQGTWQYNTGGGWVSIATTVSGSTAVLLPTTASIRFLPAADFNGTPGDLTVRLADSAVIASASSDISGHLTQTDTWSNTTTLSTSVTAVNDAPRVSGTIPDRSHLDSDVISIALAGYFSDPEGDTITYSATGLPTGLTIDANTGVVSGTIDHSDSQTSPYAVTVTATATGGTVNGSFTWTVGNPAPTATDNSAAVTVAAPTGTGNILSDDNGHGTDSDPDGDGLSVTKVQFGATTSAAPGSIAGTYGTLTWGADGAYSYTADTTNSAVIAATIASPVSDSFTYTVSDGEGGTATAILTVTITGQNDPPVLTSAIPDRSNLDADTVSVPLAGYFSDPDTGDTASYSATGLPTGLSINAATGTVSGTLASDASSAGSYTVTVTRTDGGGLSVSDTFLWTVTNPAPKATDNTNSVTVAAPTGTGNMLTDDNGKGLDSDPDHDVLSVSKVSAGGTSSSSGSIAGSYGTLTWTSNGSYTYTVDTGNAAVAALVKSGTLTETFTYTLSDAQGATDTAALVITITGSNHTPQVIGSLPDRHNLDADAVSGVNVTGAFTDLDGTDGAVYTATGLPIGLAIDATTGIISGTVATDDSTHGAWQVTVTRSDTAGASASARFTWTIDNPAPTAFDNSRSVRPSSPTASGNMLGDNDGAGLDRDPDGDALTVTQVSGQGSYGSLSWSADGSYTYSLDKTKVASVAAGTVLSDSFVYTLSDGQGGTSSATLTITITAEGQAGGTNVSKSTAGTSPFETSGGQTPSTSTSTGTGGTKRTDTTTDPQGTSRDTTQDSGVTIKPIVMPVFDSKASAVGSVTPSLQQERDELSMSFTSFLDQTRQWLFSDELNPRHPAIDPLELTVALQDRVLGEGVQTFSLPRNAFRHTNPSALINVEAKQTDGSPLPDFVVFDQRDHTFRVDTDAARAQGIEAVDIRITGRDTDGNHAGASFRVILTEQKGHKGPKAPPADHAPEAPGQRDTLLWPGDGGTSGMPVKPGLGDQIRRYGQFGQMQQRDQLVADAARLSAGFL
jgi:VCBS repeat-containing protein